MRPVMHRRRACAQRLGQPQPHAGVMIARRKMAAQRVGHRKVTALGIVNAHHRAQQTGPQMPVRLDKTRHADHTRAVDHRRRRCGDIARHGTDGAITHIAAREIAEGSVHGQHVGAAYQKLATRGQRTGLRRRAVAAGLRATRNTGYRQRGCRLEHVAAIAIECAHSCFLLVGLRMIRTIRSARARSNRPAFATAQRARSLTI